MIKNNNLICVFKLPYFDDFIIFFHATYKKLTFLSRIISFYQKEGFNFLKLDFLNDKVKCSYCDFETDEIHQNRPIIVRDLSICGKGVYLQLPRRQIYCPYCQKYSTERLDFLDKGKKYTNRYEEYIYERVKELTVEQISYNEQLSAEQVQNIFSRIEGAKKKTGQCLKE
jgi:transposase